MIDLLTDASEILVAAKFAVDRVAISNRETLVFENPTCIGFLLAYDSAFSLLSEWAEDSQEVIRRYAFSLRQAGEKAWNVYVVLLSPGPKHEAKQEFLAELEENLVGTRKIARDGVSTRADLQAALLPFLPIQTAPNLEPVDMPEEIRMRASDVGAQSLSAFLSSANEATVLQVLEESK
jgi:hypothetical protein